MQDLRTDAHAQKREQFGKGAALPEHERLGQKKVERRMR